MRYYLGPWLWDATFLGGGAWVPPVGTVGLIDLRSLPSQGKKVTVEGFGFFTTPDSVTLNSDYRLLGQGDLRSINISNPNRTALRTLLGIADLTGTTVMDCLRDLLINRGDPTGQLRWKPLLPTTQRVSEIHLGGHSKVWEALFDINSPDAALAIATMQEDYRDVRRRALAGDIRTHDGPDRQFHRRVLDALGEKFGIGNPEDVFIPTGLPKETRLAHKTTITDNFNRIDADALGSSSEGWSWTEVSLDSDIVSNQCRLMSADERCANRAESDLSSADHYSQAVFAAVTAVGGYLEMRCRFASAANTAYIYQRRSALNRTLIKIVAGTPTNLLSDASGPNLSLPDTIKVDINGSTLTGYLNGVSEKTTTDTAITGNTRTGNGGIPSGSGGRIDIDDFEAADLGGAPAARYRYLTLMGVS